MTLLNAYLNSYTEKLARGDPDAPKMINIDKTDFYKIVKDVKADTYNPYMQAEYLKNEINDLQFYGDSLAKERRDNKDSLIKRRKEEKEEIEFIKAIKKIMVGSMKDPTEMSRLYKKGISINSFKNFKSVMEDLQFRSAADQASVVRKHEHNCKRNSCHKRAATFYMGPPQSTRDQRNHEALS